LWATEAFLSEREMKHFASIGFWIAGVIIFFAASGWSASLEPDPEKVMAGFNAVFPSARSVAIIYSDPGSEAYVGKAGAAAKKQDIAFKAVKIKSFKDIPPSVRSLFGKIDTLWLVDDPMISQPDALNYLLLNAVQQQWKTIVLKEDWVRKGGLFHLTGEGETVINKRILEFLKLTVPEGKVKIRYYGEKEK
jgi:hypothetical protein